MTLTTLVIGATAAAREAAIAALLEPGVDTALILEGFSDGISRFDNLAFAPHIARLAPACACCIGNLPMRITLNRILHRRPARLYIALATSEHLARVQAFLHQPPYDNLLQLTKDLHV